MDVIVLIPDEFAVRFGAGPKLARRMLETFALDEYREGRLTRPELRKLLGFGTRGELDAFLKQHGVVESVTAEEFERQMQDLDRIGL